MGSQNFGSNLPKSKAQSNLSEFSIFVQIRHTNWGVENVRLKEWMHSNTIKYSKTIKLARQSLAEFSEAAKRAEEQNRTARKVTFHYAFRKLYKNGEVDAAVAMRTTLMDWTEFDQLIDEINKLGTDSLAQSQIGSNELLNKMAAEGGVGADGNRRNRSRFEGFDRARTQSVVADFSTSMTNEFSQNRTV